MNARTRRVVTVAAALALAAPLAGCGSAKQAGGGGEGGGKKDGPLTIGILLPENQTARYERFDRPLLESRIRQLGGGDTKILYSNAQQDASLQQQQAGTMIAKKVDALILDAVDAKSAAASVRKADESGIPVVAYDRLAEGPVSAYTSVDNRRVGRIQGRALLDRLKEEGKGKEDGGIVMMNGSVTDPNARMYKDGAHDVLDGKVSVVKEYDTKEWKPENANANMKGALSSVGKDGITGVYSANDGMAGGVITALRGAGFDEDEMPPVTGQDAELPAVQRIIAGRQFMSVYKPYVPETRAAAEFAVELARGRSVRKTATSATDSATEKNIPTAIVTPLALTRENVADYVGKKGFFTRAEICTEKFADACKDAGL